MTEAPGFPVNREARPARVESSLLRDAEGVRHVFAGREAGWGTPAWARLGLPRSPLFARQVHGAAVAAIEDAAALGRFELAPPAADAIVTALPGVPLGVFTADCVPVVVWDPKAPALAVVHAGWRGIAAGTVRQALRIMAERFGSHPGDCLAATGPSIAAGCYEVGEDVWSAFGASLLRADELLTPGRPGHWWADLREAARRQLAEAGVPPDRVAVCPYCTHCTPEVFFSARRDGAGTGRQPTLAWLR